jgi:hypothetical protein
VIKITYSNYLLWAQVIQLLFKLDTTFADPAVATEVLTQIYQNWPA